MTTIWRIVLIGTLASGALAASSILTGCNDDVPTPPWPPNYVDSGYGGKAGSAATGGGGAKAGAGEAGERDSAGNSGEGGESP